MSIATLLKKIADDYPAARAIRNSSATDAVLASCFAVELIQAAIPCCLTNRNFTVEFGAGMGMPAHCPWIGVFDPNVRGASAQDGYNVAYIFGWLNAVNQTLNPRHECVYLVILMGSKTKATMVDVARLAKELEARAKAVSRSVPYYSPRAVAAMTLNAGDRGMAADLEQAFAFGFKKYELANLPPDYLLEKDLEMILRLYGQLVDGNGRWW